jgi:hypothetical protein
MLLPHPRTVDAVRSDLAKYYGMVSEVDAAIGRVLEAVESIGQLENTIIVIAGDNGLAVGSHGLLGKQNLYDHSMRVPLVIRGPGVPRGERRDALVYLFDLFRTVADLAGVEASDTAEGENLVPLLRGKKQSVRESVFYAYRDLQRGVRTSDNWKMIRYNVGGEERVQLFDLNVDPYELTNLADDPSAQPQYRRLTSLLLSESAANNDRLDLSAPNWGKPPPERAQNVEHAAVGASVALSNTFSKKYPGRGAAGLVDGVVCTSDFKADCWHGLEGQDLEAILDLGSAVSLSEVSARFIRNNGAWIFLPLQLQVSSSVDGIRWERIATMKTTPATESDAAEVRSLSSRFRPHEARFIKVHAVNRGVCPEWHAGAGAKAWMFVDEIELR